MTDDIAQGCNVEGCDALAAERAPRIFFCDRHWDALCDAYVHEHRARPATPIAAPAGQAPTARAS